MSINLPSVIQSVINLSSDIKESEPLVQNDPNVKKIIICISKNLSKEDINLLQYYGRVISYDHDIINNVDLFSVDFDYFIVDLRQLNDRMYLQKMILPNLTQLHLILYKWNFESDNGISYEVERDCFPPKQVNKQLFDQLLLQKPIQSPSCILSLLKALVCVSEQ
jgi:hypothetical protein